MTITPNGEEPRTPLEARLAELVRSRGPEPLQRGMLLVGAILIPLGLISIMLGWLGAANSPRLVEQVPYLISGGLLGLALVISGGFFYFGYWITRVAQENQQHAHRLEDVLTRLEDRLSELPNGVAGAPGLAVPRPRLMITPRGSQYHRPDCPVVAGRDDARALRRREGVFVPCKICEPDR